MTTMKTCLFAIAAVALATTGCNAVLGFKDPRLVEGLGPNQDAAIDAPIDAPDASPTVTCPTSCDPFGCDPGTMTCRPKKVFIFLSAGQYFGDGVGGRSGADLHCLQTYDADATLKARSCNRARVHSLLTVEAADTIGLMPTKFGVPSDVPIDRADDGANVADNWAMLTGLNVPHNPAANAANETAGIAWTGASGSATCLGWTSQDPNQSGATAHPTLMVTTWMNRGSLACSSLERLLCVCWSGGD